MPSAISHIPVSRIIPVSLIASYAKVIDTNSLSFLNRPLGSFRRESVDPASLYTPVKRVPVASKFNLAMKFTWNLCRSVLKHEAF